MDVDSEVQPTLQEMAKCIAVMRSDLLPALRQLDEDTVVSYYSVDEQARLYLSAAFTLALSLYSLDKLTHRQVTAATAVAPRLTGASTRSAAAAPATTASTSDTQLVLKIERITEYIKKLQELATLEKNKKLAAAAAAAAPTTAQETPANPATANASGKKRARDTPATDAGSSRAETAATKKAKAETAKAEEGTSVEAAEDVYGDAQMFSVVSRVAGETGTLVGRLLKQVMASNKE